MEELKGIIDGMKLENQRSTQNGGQDIYSESDFENVVKEFASKNNK